MKAQLKLKAWPWPARIMGGMKPKPEAPSKEAARRFLELHAEIAALEGQDHHHQDFVGCELCQKIESLEFAYKQFRKQFAPAWAREALKCQEEN